MQPETRSRPNHAADLRAHDGPGVRRRRPPRRRATCRSWASRSTGRTRWSSPRSSAGSWARGCGGSPRTGPRRRTTSSGASSPGRAWSGTAARWAARWPCSSGPGGATSSGAQVLDVAAPSLAVGYAFGRIGCQLAGDGDYGVAWDGPWAMAYPDGTVPTTEEVHPTPVYEALDDVPRRRAAVALAPPLAAGHAVRRLPDPRRARSASSSSSSGATTRCCSASPSRSCCRSR